MNKKWIPILATGTWIVLSSPPSLAEEEVDSTDNRDFNVNDALPMYRSFDGRFNNENWPDLGSVGSQLQRLTPANYADGISALLASPHLKSPRKISNIALKQKDSTATSRKASGLVWQWGQFIDHDMDLTESVFPAELAPIPVPKGDPIFDPMSEGNKTISFNRSDYDRNTGTGPNDPRQQVNHITAWLDGSMVYGSSEQVALTLRTLDGTGKLKVSDGNLLPLVDSSTGEPVFTAGDVRVNEQIGLTSMHTLFVREHNRQVKKLNKQGIMGDEAYQRARQIVGAEIQAITYNEFLPAVLGKNNHLVPYSGYNPNINAQISNEFSTAAYRFGHTMLNEQLLRLDQNGNEIEAGHIPLRDAFFNPSEIIDNGGIEPIIRGLFSQQAFNVDLRIVDSVRSFLFSNVPGSAGFDLGSLNIQRGRDHGLSSYNTTRVVFNLPPVIDFLNVSPKTGVQNKLQKAYDHVDDIDLWVGGLAEKHVKGALVGPLFHAVIKDQFERLRDGDRFWYQRVFHGESLEKLEKTRLSKIIAKNTSIEKSEMRKNVFKFVDEEGE